MNYHDVHLSDQQLLLDIEGENSARDEKRVRGHLEACWNCRARRCELENAIVEFVRVHHRELDSKLPPANGPRAVLKSRLAQLSATGPAPRMVRSPVYLRLAWAAGIVGLMTFGAFLVRSNIDRQYRLGGQAAIISIPDSRLTPGATLLLSRSAACAQANTRNKAVSKAVQRQVFEEYGIAGADPRAYEVDYLVTPALGGADDIHNLWPQSNSATVWNAQVKDALEDHLREMVCNGSLDLTEAQQEIAANWIAAYKKYFRSDKPLADR